MMVIATRIPVGLHKIIFVLSTNIFNGYRRHILLCPVVDDGEYMIFCNNYKEKLVIVTKKF